MKTVKYLFYISMLVMSLTSCNDFLTHESEDSLTADNFYTTEAELEAATAPLYNKVWYDFNDKFYYGLGDGRANNLYAPYSDYIYPFYNFTETGATGPLTKAWGSFYVVIAQANTVIKGIESNATTVSDSAKYTAIAEARFMRGVAYWYLASLWGNAIIITDNSTLVNNPIVNTNPRKDVYEFAIRDLEYAAKYLPKTVTDAGRVTKWSAYGMLSRLYLDYSGLVDNEDTPNSGVRNTEYLELARKAAKKVIDESGLSLVDNYADLFKPENNNNEESLFSLQWMSGDGTSSTYYGVTNTQQAYFACSSDITGDSYAWGYYTFASYDVMKDYETKDSIRRKATYMAYGDYYSEISKSAGGYTHEVMANSQKVCHVKKGVTGSSSDTDGASNIMCSGLNTYMLRLSEVYLNYAEAILGNSSSTTDAQALEYFNKVRTRAGVDTKTSLTYDIILHERRMEFAMEGRYWYDRVSRAYYKQTEVINDLNAENRTYIGLYDYDKYSNSASYTASSTAAAVNTFTADRLLLPYPESEVTQNPLLEQDPVSYTFTEDRITDLFE